jgi:hypothetical protein
MASIGLAVPQDAPPASWGLVDVEGIDEEPATGAGGSSESQDAASQRKYDKLHALIHSTPRFSQTVAAATVGIHPSTASRWLHHGGPFGPSGQKPLLLPQDEELLRSCVQGAQDCCVPFSWMDVRAVATQIYVDRYCGELDKKAANPLHTIPVKRCDAAVTAAGAPIEGSLLPESSVRDILDRIKCVPGKKDCCLCWWT